MSVDLNRLTAHLSPQQQAEVKKSYHRREEHSTAAFLYCFFLGIFGAHRFYLHQWRKGFAHLVIPILIAVLIVAGIVLQWPAATIALGVIPLLVIALVWEIINLFTIDSEVYQRNLKLAEQLVAKSLLSDTTIERRAGAKLDTMVNASVAQAEAAAQQERTASDVAPVSAAVSEARPAALTPAFEASSPLRDEAVGVSTGHFVQTAETRISDDTPSTRDASREELAAPTSWSDTEAVRAEDTEHAGTDEATPDVAAEPGIVGAAGAIGAAGTALFAEHEATVGEPAHTAASENVMHTHEETGYGVSDSVERTSTYVMADAAVTTDAPIAEAEPLPTSAEAAAPTWPDYPAYVEPADVAAPADSPEPSSSVSQRDVTDLGFGAAKSVPVADVATEGGVPLHVFLPGSDDALIGLDDRVASQPEAASETAASESVLLVPEEDALEGAPPSPFAPLDPSFAPTTYEASGDAPTFAAADETPMYTPTPAPASDEAPAIAPVIAEAAGAAAFAGYSAGASDMPTPASEEPADSQETLAELGRYGYGTMPAEAQAQAAQSPIAPTEPEVLLSHSDDAGAAHHAMRRIRVVRQVKVDGQVVEETAAEEYIDADADPAPVRQRLQEMLRQQAAARQQAGQGNV